MATPKHHKHCAYKKTLMCICASLEAALNEQAAKHTQIVLAERRIAETFAVADVRAQVIDAFTALIDGKFQEKHECNSHCTDERW